MWTARRSVLATVAILVAAMGSAGCGSDETRTVTVPGPGAVPTLEQDATTTTTATTPEPAQRVLASRRGTLNAVPARLQITELSRSGKTVALTVSVTNLGRGDTSLYIQDQLGDGISEDGNADDAFDGVSLLDTKNARRYLVARDANGSCVCDTNLGITLDTDAGQSVSLSATFGAPPDDVRTLNVHVPRFGTFRDVPIA